MSSLKKIVIVLITLVFIQCGKDNQFLVEKGTVGKLNKQTSIQDLNSIFANDSIVANMADDKLKNKLFKVDKEEYIVFSKKGKKILEIVPSDENDSLSKIKSIQIFDSNYKTEKGISLQSTFKDINENYLVNKVETTLTSATLFIDELNATISIDKKELGLNTFSRDEISIDQIPDIARIKYFTIWFN
ncbi:hypothetical protein [Lutibacter flavus]|uniref:Uncharacterized protein n=1 Tax=Lutibacter flavus TaxID=691689 RepID=A0A238W0U2_9FLAO|nr:hypothetical protein [Lutibacter flavus]SNR39984.1 hypothetical protein SAMN04488111_1251 [Lutibacter flavus]